MKKEESDTPKYKSLKTFGILSLLVIAVLSFIGLFLVLGWFVEGREGVYKWAIVWAASFVIAGILGAVNAFVSSAVNNIGGKIYKVAEFTYRFFIFLIVVLFAWFVWNRIKNPSEENTTIVISLACLIAFVIYYIMCKKELETQNRKNNAN